MWRQFLGFHPVTKLMMACAVIGVAASLFGLVEALRPIVRYGGGTVVDALSRFAYDLAWAIGFLGTAALVELMYRIWVELRRANAERAD